MYGGRMGERWVNGGRKKGVLDLGVHNLGDDPHARHKTVDDRPFGGGPGMLLKPEPIFEAVEKLGRENTRVILLSPAGRPFNQGIARELAGRPHLLLICGRYEGFDASVR